MTLFIVTFPFMIVAVAIAVIPLICVSRRELRHSAFEFEQYRDKHRHTHHVQRHDAHRGERGPARPAVRPAEGRRWHEPVPINGN